MQIDIHLQNTCSCLNEDDEPNDFCFGDCWSEQVEIFSDLTVHLFTDWKQRFKISGFPTWSGAINGSCTVESSVELLRAITPQGTDWQMELTIYEDRLDAHLSHHDATGRMTVTPMNEVDE
jgi:hypothetical protein